MQGIFLGNILPKSSPTNESKIFPNLNVKSAISTSIFLSTVRKNPNKKQQQQQLKHFLVVSCWSQIENLVGFSPLGRDISQLINLSGESQVTRTTSIYRGKRVIYHGKVSPATAPIIESLHAHFILTMSSFSLYPFTLIILKIPLSPAHICCWYPTQLSNAIQHNSYLHQHIPRKRNQASSCYGQKFKEIDFSALVTRWSIFPDRRS